MHTLRPPRASSRDLCSVRELYDLRTFGVVTAGTAARAPTVRTSFSERLQSEASR